MGSRWTNLPRVWEAEILKVLHVQSDFFIGNVPEALTFEGFWQVLRRTRPPALPATSRATQVPTAECVLLFTLPTRMCSQDLLECVLRTF